MDHLEHDERKRDQVFMESMRRRLPTRTWRSLLIRHQPYRAKDILQLSTAVSRLLVSACVWNTGRWRD